MKKTKYTKPGIIKVKLNHEQAVLGTCSSGALGARHNTGSILCNLGTGCKRDRQNGDNAGTS